jgi:hypothetical protein
MQTLQEAFNHLFIKGLEFNNYKEATAENLHQTLQNSIDYTKEELSKLSQEEIEALNQPFKLLIISETWCGDCKINVPIAVTMAEFFSNWQYKIVYRDENENIVNQYYTLGGRMKIPYIIFADSEGNEYDRWVERPTQSYLSIAEIQKKRLNKEDYIKEYKSHPLLQQKEITKATVNELLLKAKRMSAIYYILPNKPKSISN